MDDERKKNEIWEQFKRSTKHGACSDNNNDESSVLHFQMSAKHLYIGFFAYLLRNLTTWCVQLKKNHLNSLSSHSGRSKWCYYLFIFFPQWHLCKRHTVWINIYWHSVGSREFNWTINLVELLKVVVLRGSFVNMMLLAIFHRFFFLHIL